MTSLVLLFALISVATPWFATSMEGGFKDALYLTKYCQSMTEDGDMDCPSGEGQKTPGCISGTLGTLIVAVLAVAVALALQILSVMGKGKPIFVWITLGALGVAGFFFMVAFAIWAGGDKCNQELRE